MAAIEPLYRLLGVDTSQLSKEEKLLLEAELFICICEELKEKLRKEHKEYFCLMKFTLEMEKTMLDSFFVQSIIRDLIVTNEYTIEGIARYTDTHEEVVDELANGYNSMPSALFLQRIIELHRSIRPELYQTIMRKVTMGYIANKK